ncbi:MAG: cytochrome c biogenesis protein CcsA [Woeseiaceae bacterium]|nr:cytochrome c biogenesis protein CcsA [Woeseiaceae bacterium]
MSEITIFFLYLLAALSFAFSRLPTQQTREHTYSRIAFFVCGAAIVIHGRLLYADVLPGGALTINNAVSLIGFQLALIALFGAFKDRLRGLCAGLLLIGAVTALATGADGGDAAASQLSWQLRTHVLTSLFAYGLLTAGAILAIFALIQENRLQQAKLSPVSALFAPLETTEKLLYAVTGTGFIVLALSVVSGVTFIENLFAQHLVHKTILSLLALLVFGVLLIGRRFAGWRGKRAVYLYLAGFAILCLAYFGSRLILEEILGRSWS